MHDDDRKPPKLAGDERATLLTLLQFQRESIVRKVAGVPDEDARASRVASGTTLLWLVAHLALAESSWVEVSFAGGVPRDDPAPSTLADAIAAYRATWARVDAVVADASLDERCRVATTAPPVNLRWILAHLLEETARHAGHADILRELYDGSTGR